jgi:hypothetical protein
MLPVQTPKSPQTFKHTPNIRTFKSPPNPILKRSFEAFAGHYIDNRDLLVPGKPEVRRYKAIYVVGDDETGYFSDEVVVTVQP